MIADQYLCDEFALYNGDCCEVLASMPDESVHMSVFSPPFADLYSYSDSPQDMGNCLSYKQFFEHFAIVAENLFRVLIPGRVVAVHCMDLPAMKERDGYIGLKEFPDDIIKLFKSFGFIFHSRIIIWKDPLIEATRTKSLGLMHKQLCKDSAMCRQGIPDQVVVLRKPGDNPLPVSHEEGLADYCGSDDPGGHGIKRSHNIWRAYASPVWSDIRQTRTLNHRKAREEKDEKHICPLQLDVIERAVILWSNPGETVLTPFAGVGSEVYGSIINGRRAVGIELKPSYYRQAVENCTRGVKELADGNAEQGLFDALEGVA